MKLVLFGSKSLARALKVTGGVLLALSVPALLWWPLWPAFVMTGLLLIVTAWKTVAPDEACVLCERRRAVVLSLIAGEHASVCGDCAVTAAGVAVIDQRARAASKSLWVMSLLRAMPDHTPNEATSGLIAFASRLPGVDRTALTHEAHRLGNHRAQVTLFEALKEDERTSMDWVNLGVALNHLHRFDEALAATRHATDRDSAPWLLNNVAAIKLRAGQPDATELQRLVADVEQARALIIARNAPGYEATLATFDGNLAELQLRLGQPQRALATLDDVGKRAPEHVRRLLTRHAALTALGRHEEAKATAVEAKNLLHPDSLDAAEVDALG